MMIGLPKTTEFNKRIPKQKFYENMEISSAIKQSFTEQIKMIYWRNKIAASTTNLAVGNEVTELEVFEIRLNSSELDEKLLRQIDGQFHIIFYFYWNMRGNIRRGLVIRKLQKRETRRLK